ncbi:MAG: hypothetical protein WBL44_01280 [Nitrososphaeraceae archaeon]|jgi:hypothetical protein
MNRKKSLKSGTIASKNSILALTIAAVMLVGGIAIVTSSVIPAALADKGGDPNNKGPSQENAKERDLDKFEDLSDDNLNNDNGKKHAHDNMHDGKGVEGSSQETCPPNTECMSPSPPIDPPTK